MIDRLVMIYELKRKSIQEKKILSVFNGNYKVRLKEGQEHKHFKFFRLQHNKGNIIDFEFETGRGYAKGKIIVDNFTYQYGKGLYHHITKSQG